MSLKGEGCDCIGLVRGVWREVVGEEPCEMPPYSPDWAEVDGGERLVEGLTACLTAVELDEARPGDVLVFRMKPWAVAKHAAVLTVGGLAEAGAKIVHAYWGHAVVESWLGPFWRRHAVAAFRFPGGGAADQARYPSTTSLSPSRRDGSLVRSPSPSLRDGEVQDGVASDFKDLSWRR